jgi:hypothetical protein
MQNQCKCISSGSYVQLIGWKDIPGTVISNLANMMASPPLEAAMRGDIELDGMPDFSNMLAAELLGDSCF